MENKALDNFASQMLNNAIQGINQATAIKQKEVNYWKDKARSLAAKYHACLICLNDEGWMPENLTCRACQSKKETPHA